MILFFFPELRIFLRSCDSVFCPELRVFFRSCDLVFFPELRVFLGSCDSFFFPELRVFLRSFPVHGGPSSPDIPQRFGTNSWELVGDVWTDPFSCTPGASLIFLSPHNATMKIGF